MYSLWHRPRIRVQVAVIGRVLLSSLPGPAFTAITAAAAAADVAIVCVTTGSGEGSDRATLRLTPLDDALVAAVAAAQQRTVVVVHNPGAVVMPWADSVGAIVAAWYPGQGEELGSSDSLFLPQRMNHRWKAASTVICAFHTHARSLVSAEMGNGLADVLFGDVNPSGRTPVTFPVDEADTPLRTPSQYPGVNGTVTYTEGLEIGYRYFDRAGITPRFAFGHGLSYTSFAYANLTVHDPDPNVKVTVQVSRPLRVCVHHSSAPYA